MGWVSLILQVIKAIPEIIKLINAMVKAGNAKKARDDWEDFEERFKNRKKDEEIINP